MWLNLSLYSEIFLTISAIYKASLTASLNLRLLNVSYCSIYLIYLIYYYNSSNLL